MAKYGGRAIAKEAKPDTAGKHFAKNSLAHILKNDVSPAMLEQVEFFQNQFLNKDTVITLLRHDIAALGKPSEMYSATTKNHDRLQEDLGKMEREFAQLKFKYNQYIAGVL